MTLLSPPPRAPVTTPPASLDVAARHVERRLDALLGAEVRRWARTDDDLAEPLEALRRYVLRGGKRLRPAFVHWGFVAAGGDPTDPASAARVDDAGAAFELLHAFALLHDDVMDGSDTRRGEPTTHIEQAARHARDGWRGESRRFGESVAILVGDLAHVFADRTMAHQPEAARAVWRELQVELMMGQYLDVLGTARGDRSATKARLVVRLKSGRYTIERPLQLGAALAGVTTAPSRSAHPEGGRATPLAPDAGAAPVADVLAAYGEPLGEAFQLRDDVLGAFGVATTTGKPVGDDLREGKPTLLLAHAVDHATPAQRARLDRVGAPDLTVDDIADLQDVLVATGALARIERTIDALTNEAVEAVVRGGLPPEAEVALVELAHFIAGRDA